MNKILSLLPVVLLQGCASSLQPIRTEPAVDLQRFMGDWYVLAAIPTAIEDEAYNAVESYQLTEDGEIDTTFTFLDGGFDGERKEYNPTGFVKDEQSNAIWGMQFIWPIKADYRIVFVDDDYSQTIVGRQKRDYAWIMARSPDIPEADYQRLVAMLEQEGYDTSALRRVPHRWGGEPTGG